MANRCWLLAGVFAVVSVVACNSDKPSPFATKPAAAGSGGSAAVAATTPPAPTAAPVDAAPVEEPLKVGERIWSREQWDDGRTHAGKIKSVNADGTFRISWDEAEDSNMAASQLSRTKPPPPAVTGLQVGDRVDGLWSDNRWYPGKVGKVNADGTYFINFDDGDKAPMAANRVRRHKSSGGGGASSKAGGKPCNEGSSYTRCDEYHCFNLKQDDHNCGACGHECPKTARTCVSSECKCLSGTYDSDGNCN